MDVNTEASSSVKRLDLHLEVCLKCGKGVMSFLRWDADRVKCLTCGAEMSRYMTKKERLKYMQKEGVDENS